MNESPWEVRYLLLSRIIRPSREHEERISVSTGNDVEMTIGIVVHKLWTETDLLL